MGAMAPWLSLMEESSRTSERGSESDGREKKVALKQYLSGIKRFYGASATLGHFKLPQLLDTYLRLHRQVMKRRCFVILTAYLAPPLLD